MYLNQFWLTGKYIVLISSIPFSVIGCGNLFEKVNLEIRVRFCSTRIVYLFRKVGNNSLNTSKVARTSLAQYVISDLNCKKKFFFSTNYRCEILLTTD